MKKILSLSLLLLSVPLTANAEVSNKVHRRCKDVKDYAGCVKTMTKGVDGDKEECEVLKNGKSSCIAKKGTDPLGLPKIEGWKYWYEPENRRVIYLAPSLYKVKARGVYGRYLHNRALLRSRINPKAGRAPSSGTIGVARTNCYGSGSSVNCTTTPAPSFSFPGKAATPGGIEEIFQDQIADCKNLTEVFFKNGKQTGKWRKMAKAQRAHFKDLCSDFSNYKKSPFMNFAEGEPNKDDLSMKNLEYD